MHNLSTYLEKYHFSADVKETNARRGLKHFLISRSVAPQSLPISLSSSVRMWVHVGMREAALAESRRVFAEFKPIFSATHFSRLHRVVLCGADLRKQAA